MWSRALAAGYLDHPPMVAWFIRAGTAIAGDGPLGVRLLAPLSTALGSILLADAADRLFPKQRPGVRAAVLLNATLLVGAGSVTMTPDTPLLLFWTATFAAVTRAGSGAGGWALVGLAAGCALLSKYTAVLLAPALLLWLLLDPSRRARLRQPGPWIATAIAAIVFAPTLAWNAEHGWTSFAKQGRRAGDWDPARAAQFLGELIGGQIGLATPLIAVLCAAGLMVAVRRWRDAGRALIATLAVVPLAVFVEHAIGDRVQANWPAIIYPTAAIAAALLDGRWRRLTRPAIALGAGVTALVWLQSITGLIPLSPRLDPTTRQLAGWPEFAAAIAIAARTAGAGFVAADGYGEASELARLVPNDVAILGVEPRWAYAQLPSGAGLIAGRTGLLLRNARRADPPDPADWATITPLATITRGPDGRVAEAYRLFRVVGRDAASTPIALLPRPR